MPHSCSGGVTAFLSTGGKQMVDNSPGEMSLTGRQRRELPTKSSPIRGPGREQWAKCRVSQSSFTQQLAENQQVGVDGAPHRREEGNLTTARWRAGARRRIIKIIREPISDGVIPHLFVGFVAAPARHLRTVDGNSAFSENAQVHATSDASHLVEECAHRDAL